MHMNLRFGMKTSDSQFARWCEYLSCQSENVRCTRELTSVIKHTMYVSTYFHTETQAREHMLW